MSQPIRGRAGHLLFPIENVSANQRPGKGKPSCLPISPKSTNLVEDVKILLPVMFRCILFCGFKGEVENVSAN